MQAELFEKQNRDFEEKWKRYTALVKLLTEENDFLKTENQQYKEKLKDLEAHLLTFKKNFEVMQSENSALQKNFGVIQSENSTLKNQMISLVNKRNIDEFLATVGDFIVQFKRLLFVTIKAGNPKLEFGKWGEFAQAETDEFRLWRKKQQRPRPLYDVLMNALKELQVSEDIYKTLLFDVNRRRVESFHQGVRMTYEEAKEFVEQSTPNGIPKEALTVLVETLNRNDMF